MIDNDTNLMKKNIPLVSIIILNYNQINVTCEFIESTKKLTYPNYEIIMIDNASKEDPCPRIQSEYPDVRLVVNDKNLGFTGGNNKGMKVANGDYYLIVNNDTEVTDNLLEKLLEPFDKDPSIGVVSPKIRYFSHPEVIQYAGYTEINPVTGRNRAIGTKEVDNGQYDFSGYTAYAHGAAMLVKKEVVEKVGMFPEQFFIYYEELDWSAHIRRAGYKIYYQADALIYHKESITMGKESAIKAYFHNRNRILFMKRNSNKQQFLLFILFLTFFVIPKNIFNYVRKGQIMHLKNFIKALVWNVTGSKYGNL